MTAARISIVQLIAKFLVVAFPSIAGLFLSGCATVAGEILVRPIAEGMARAVIEIPGDVRDKHTYQAHYANSDLAVINGLDLRSSLFGHGHVSFLCVDGEDADPAGYAYWRFSPIYVSPGLHRVAVRAKTAFGQQSFTEFEFNASAHHAYRVCAEQVDGQLQLQVWDETDRAAKPRLLADVRRFPVVDHIDALLRAHKTNHAVVTGDLPPLIHYAPDQQAVYLQSLDGRAAPDGWASPTEGQNRMYVPAGTHRVVVVVYSGYWGRETHVSPAVEFGVEARHLYRITARPADKLILLQFWDETWGTDGRTLLKEVPLDEARS